MCFVGSGRLRLREVRKDGKQDAKSQQKVEEIEASQVEQTARTQLLESNDQKLITNRLTIQHT